jgi:hypothetical protein
VGCIDEGVVVLGHAASLNVCNLPTDLDHGLTEPAANTSHHGNRVKTYLDINDMACAVLYAEPTMALYN